MQKLKFQSRAIEIQGCIHQIQVSLVVREKLGLLFTLKFRYKTLFHEEFHWDINLTEITKGKVIKQNLLAITFK